MASHFASQPRSSQTFEGQPTLQSGQVSKPASLPGYAWTATPHKPLCDCAWHHPSGVERRSAVCGSGSAKEVCSRGAGSRAGAAKGAKGGAHHPRVPSNSGGGRVKKKSPFTSTAFPLTSFVAAGLWANSWLQGMELPLRFLRSSGHTRATLQTIPRPIPGPGSQATPGGTDQEPDHHLAGASPHKRASASNNSPAQHSTAEQNRTEQNRTEQNRTE
jgi:hypothetical protein